MTATITTALIALAALMIALLLAFVPLRLVLDMVARNVVQPVREFIQRQRDRRTVERGTPDRRRV